ELEKGREEDDDEVVADGSLGGGFAVSVASPPYPTTLAPPPSILHLTMSTKALKRWKDKTRPFFFSSPHQMASIMSRADE
ncbi:hypothetical protein L249_3162, partial [Ophiocordyceps polyrhachis-furcata BCC 54312]